MCMYEPFLIQIKHLRILFNLFMKIFDDWGIRYIYIKLQVLCWNPFQYQNEFPSNYFDIYKLFSHILAILK